LWLSSLLLAPDLQVAWLNAEVIAAEMLALVQVRVAPEAAALACALQCHLSSVTATRQQHVLVPFKAVTGAAFGCNRAVASMPL
jgi:hypothetical protein